MGNARAKFTAFVPNGDSRRDTAILLVGTADEHGIDQRSIRATQSGFDITDELADVLYADGASTENDPVDDDPKTPAEAPAKTESKTSKTSKTSTTKKPSGNRAAKNTDSEKE